MGTILRILGWWFIGMAVALIVALVCAVLDQRILLHSHRVSTPSTSWTAALPPQLPSDLPPPDRILRLTYLLKTTDFGTWTETPPAASDLTSIQLESFGLPFRSLSHISATRRNRATVFVRIRAGDSGRLFGDELPATPLIPGLLASGAFYAALLWLLSGGPRASRARRRVARGLCENCQHPRSRESPRHCDQCRDWLSKRKPPHTPWNRRLFVTVSFLIAGTIAAITASFVASAVGTTTRSVTHSGPPELTSQWPIEVSPDGVPPKYRQATKSWWGSIESTLSSNGNGICQYLAGFPFACFTGFEPPPGYRRDWQLSIWTFPPLRGVEVRVAYGPIYTALILNILAWSLALFVLVSALRSVRALWRRFRHRCAVCGYPREGLTAAHRCPECGTFPKLSRRTPIEPRST